MQETLVEAYPLHWPIGYERARERKDSRFKTTVAKARDYLKAEVQRIGGTALIISTNLPLKDNGDLYADFGRYKIEDPGVAIYFKRNKLDVCLCTDAYNRIWENLHALGRTIAAMRQVERDGVPGFMNRAFTGFTGLPEVTEADTKIWQTLGLPSKPKAFDEVKIAFREQSKIVHPDKPTGSIEKFHELNDAFRKAQQLFQTTPI